MLQPRINALLEEAKSYSGEGGTDAATVIQKTAKELTRKVSGAHTTLTRRRKTLHSVDKKLYRYQHDLESVQKWLEDAEKAMEMEEDEEKFKVNLNQLWQIFSGLSVMKIVLWQFMFDETIRISRCSCHDEILHCGKVIPF